MTVYEAAAAVWCLLAVLALGTHGSHLGAALCVLGAWWHDPVLLLTGVVFAALTRPWSDGGEGGGSGRPKHV